MKALRALLIATIVFFIVCTVGLAWYWHSLPVYIDIIEGEHNLGFYETSNFTERVIEIQARDYGRGMEHTIPVWLRNDGVETMEIQASITPESIDWGNVVVIPGYIGVLAANETAYCDINVWIDANATLGEVLFSVNFTDLR
jgi:hypothetical protein